MPIPVGLSLQADRHGRVSTTLKGVDTGMHIHITEATPQHAFLSSCQPQPASLGQASGTLSLLPPNRRGGDESQNPKSENISRSSYHQYSTLCLFEEERDSPPAMDLKTPIPLAPLTIEASPLPTALITSAMAFKAECLPA
jgi:hypothetical protein